MSTQREQIAAEAKKDRTLRFTSLAHLLTPAFLVETWQQMNRRGASGVDGGTTKEFEHELETRVQDIHARLKAGTYKAPPVRRVEIAKGPGKVGTRPLGIPTVEDRLVQRAVARILEAVFEADFLDCSYGFRPGRSPHQALRTLRSTLISKKVRHLYEADIRGYFNHINHQWLMRMVAHRIADTVILRLIGKWLRAVVGGHFRYYGVPMNQPALALFRFRVGWSWHRSLSRRSQNGRVHWDRMRRLLTRWLPLPTVCHPYPLRRMGVAT